MALGAQAIEKFLKIWLLFNDPTDRVERLRHSLLKLLETVTRVCPERPIPVDFSEIADCSWRHYEARYPDNPEGRAAMTTAEIHDLDEIIIFLNEHLPCPRNVKYRTGLYPMITFSLGRSGTVPPWEYWIKHNNTALMPLLPRIEIEHFEVMADLFPRQRDLNRRS